MKTCNHDNCTNPVFSKGYCQWHAPKKARKAYQTKAIKKVSTRQQKLNALYKIARDSFMKEHDVCQAQLEGCTYHSVDLHHRRGRGEYLLDTRYFMAVCRHCHTQIENRTDKAKELGFILPRLSINI